MEIFNNRQRSGYEEIVSYGPRWWTEYREMDAVYHFEGFLLDLIAVFLERTVNNQFPSQADIYALQMYEHVLGIESDDSISIEERRREVAAYYSGTGKLSRSSIKNMIRNYTGCESEMWWRDANLHIRVFMVDEKPFSSKKIYNIMSRRMPAYLDFLIREVIAVFELHETYSARNRYRMPFSWWDRTLDGSQLNDGSNYLDSEYPTKFLVVYRYSAESDNVLEHRQIFRCQYDAPEEISLVPKYRIYMPWWEGTRMLDGQYSMDGNFALDQDRSPVWNKETIRFFGLTEEDFRFNMYVPSKAAVMNGVAAMDGAILLNSGREVL